MNLFVYGTLKRGQGNDVLLRKCEFIGEDSIEGFEMRSVSGAFPAINKAEGVVHGEVYKINWETLYRIDRLEGYPIHYNREEVLTVGGESTWVYFYKTIEEDLRLIPEGKW